MKTLCRSLGAHVPVQVTLAHKLDGECAKLAASVALGTEGAPEHPQRDGRRYCADVPYTELTRIRILSQRLGPELSNAGRLDGNSRHLGPSMNSAPVALRDHPAPP